MPYTAARVDVALDSANAAVTHAQLHSGDPGAAGTANVLAESSRTAITLAAAAGGAASGMTTFTITGAAGPITHVSLWNDPSAGTFQGSGVLAPQETFAGAGELDVTVNTTASST